MNLRDLQYLVALAEHRHFGRAAEACHVSQPTLSTQIRKLEEDLGVELVERHPRQILVTAVGERIVERARSILRETGQIRQIARSHHDPEAGSLRLGLFPTLGPYLLPHVVHKVRRRFPRLELLLVEDKSADIAQMLLAGELDAAILALPVEHPQLHAQFLFEEPFLLAVPADHRLANHDRPLALSALHEENVLLLEDGHCLREQALSVCHLAGAGERDGFRATSLETLRQMVAAGVGITLLPALAVSAPVPVSDDIRLLRFKSPPPSRQIAMFWRKSSAHRGFLPHLAAVFSDLPAALFGNDRPGQDPASSATADKPAQAASAATPTGSTAPA
ncbi:MAG: LysR substrate-binding domain-containing protein [Xanthomonadales bacterium]|nr:LysR substrate-binding domain-containing protein [Xanthomonadales bacterium]